MYNYDKPSEDLDLQLLNTYYTSIIEYVEENDVKRKQSQINFAIY